MEENRPCDQGCIWHTEYGCSIWECKPLTRAEVKEMISPLHTVKVDDELKPCPFCGSTDIEIAWFGKYGESVICLECGGTGAQYTDRAKAIIAWNKRANE